MKTIITADWHFGHPGRLNDLKWSFFKMVDYCEENDIKVIKMLGDLTHDREYITHDVSNCLVECLEYMANKEIEMVCLIGNHDMFMRHKWSINALKPFSQYIHLVDYIGHFTLDGRKFWVVPFVEHEQSFMKVINDINKMAESGDVLLTHIGIASALMNACFLVQNWNVVSFESTKFSRVYAGHFHCMQKVGDKSFIPGSPISFKFDEGLVDHGFFVYDTETNEHEFKVLYDLAEDDDNDIPPDFITAPSDDIDEIIDSCDGDNVKIILKESDDKESITKRLQEAGAKKIIFVKPKEKEISVKVVNDSTSDGDMFSAWLHHDKPEHLNYELLMSLEKDIRSQTRMVTEDD